MQQQHGQSLPRGAEPRLHGYSPRTALEEARAAGFAQPLRSGVPYLADASAALVAVRHSSIMRL